MWCDVADDAGHVFDVRSFSKRFQLPVKVMRPHHRHKNAPNNINIYWQSKVRQQARLKRARVKNSQPKNASSERGANWNPIRELHMTVDAEFHMCIRIHMYAYEYMIYYMLCYT